eukprot:TRINITY_DN5486_c0_g4_i1.p1 TRINITY_DN5486_c0_g4~~TRINITY_DN5486_c0_g4_i1.p1  ORF type:complete len:179 (-),score=49.74 TRINITY_DN5486_c0_g4_i1:81-617(-)
MDASTPNVTNDRENRKRDIMRRELELELENENLKQQLKQREEKLKQTIAKKDGHIEALQTSILIAQKQHFHEMETMKTSFQKELYRMQDLWAKSMNDRMDEKIQFHLEQQSEKLETKLEELDNTSASIEDRIDVLDEKFDNVDEKFNCVDRKCDDVGQNVNNVVEKIDCLVAENVKKL